MPDTFCAAMYLAPSLPVIVFPQHLFAGYGGLGRDKYFFVVCITHFVPLLRRCTRFQYWRILVYVFFSVVAVLAAGASVALSHRDADYVCRLREACPQGFDLCLEMRANVNLGVDLTLMGAPLCLPA